MLTRQHMTDYLWALCSWAPQIASRVLPLCLCVASVAIGGEPRDGQRGCHFCLQSGASVSLAPSKFGPIIFSSYSLFLHSLHALFSTHIFIVFHFFLFWAYPLQFQNVFNCTVKVSFPRLPSLAECTVVDIKLTY